MVACSKVTCETVTPGHPVWPYAMFPDQQEEYTFATLGDTLTLSLQKEYFSPQGTMRCGLRGALTDCFCYTESIQQYGNEQLTLGLTIHTSNSENAGRAYAFDWELTWDKKPYNFTLTIKDTEVASTMKASTEALVEYADFTLTQVIPIPELAEGADCRLFFKAGEGLVALRLNGVGYQRLSQ
jgi:hypothetical protein